MLTVREQKLVNWLRKAKVATMPLLLQQFQLSRMTVFRTLKKYGYFASYNHNAAYYALHDVPQFDEWGLWAYRDVRFSRHRTLLHTIVALVEQSPTGMTVAELEQRLQTEVANLLSRLVRDGRLTQQPIDGRRAVYLSGVAPHARRQYQHRQQEMSRASSRQPGFPEGCSPVQIIEILGQMIRSPGSDPDQLAGQLQRRGLAVTARQVRRVREHYALEKKRQARRSSN